MQVKNITKVHNFQYSKHVSKGGIDFKSIAVRLRRMGSPGTLPQIERRMRRHAIEIGLVAKPAVIRH